MICVYVGLSNFSTFNILSYGQKIHRLERTVIVDVTTVVEVTFTGASGKVVVVAPTVMVCFLAISDYWPKTRIATRSVGCRVRQDSRSRLL